LCLSCGKMAAAGETDSVLARDLLEKVYGTGLCIGQHPLNGRPLVLPEI
ncbi:MAG: ABC transporter ATP-binding protein, partial [Bacteroidetes bacterium]|nr:ABC transporter ATP-binding protein [Candidatus Pullibacteroides excrementavium]